jgi:hypothetical protein
VLYLVKMVGNVAVGSGWFGVRTGAPNWAQWDEGILTSDANYCGTRSAPKTETQKFQKQLISGATNLPTDLVRVVELQTKLLYRATDFILIGGDADAAIRTRFKINGSFLTPWPNQQEVMVDDNVERVLTWPKYTGLDFTKAEAEVMETQWQTLAMGSWDEGVTTLYAVAAEAWVYYVKIPTITAVSPDNGTVDGGDTVTITGEGFLDANPGTPDVKFDGVSGTNPNVTSDGSMTIDTPAHVAGAVDVTVDTNYGTSLALSGGYLYRDFDKTMDAATGTEKIIAAATGTEKTTATATGTEKAIASATGTEKTIAASTGTEKVIP